MSFFTWPAKSFANVASTRSRADYRQARALVPELADHCPHGGTDFGSQIHGRARRHETVDGPPQRHRLVRLGAALQPAEIAFHIAYPLSSACLATPPSPSCALGEGDVAGQKRMSACAASSSRKRGWQIAIKARARSRCERPSISSATN